MQKEKGSRESSTKIPTGNGIDEETKCSWLVFMRVFCRWWFCEMNELENADAVKLFCDGLWKWMRWWCVCLRCFFHENELMWWLVWWAVVFMTIRPWAFWGNFVTKHYHDIYRDIMPRMNLFAIFLGGPNPLKLRDTIHPPGPYFALWYQVIGLRSLLSLRMTYIRQ